MIKINDRLMYIPKNPMEIQSPMVSGFGGAKIINVESETPNSKLIVLLVPFSADYTKRVSR